MLKFIAKIQITIITELLFLIANSNIYVLSTVYKSLKDIKTEEIAITSIVISSIIVIIQIICYIVNIVKNKKKQEI